MWWTYLYHTNTSIVVQLTSVDTRVIIRSTSTVLYPSSTSKVPRTVPYLYSYKYLPYLYSYKYLYCVFAVKQRQKKKLRAPYSFLHERTLRNISPPRHLPTRGRCRLAPDRPHTRALHDAKTMMTRRVVAPASTRTGGVGTRRVSRRRTHRPATSHAGVRRVGTKGKLTRVTTATATSDAASSAVSASKDAGDTFAQLSAPPEWAVDSDNPPLCGNFAPVDGEDASCVSNSEDHRFPAPLVVFLFFPLSWTPRSVPGSRASDSAPALASE